MNILTFSTLWPNHMQPLHGLFVRERMKALTTRCTIKVVAPVPWFLPVRWFGDLYYTYSHVKPYERQGDVDVFHPRYLVLPKIWKVVDGFLMYYGLRRKVRQMAKDWHIDLIDAHWAFPDGYAAGRIARELKLPYTVTVRGNDMTVFAREKQRGAAIRQTLLRANKVICVSRSLQDEALKLGIPHHNTVVVENGVDPKTFSRVDPAEARQRTGLPPNARIILGLGHLSERKGFHLLIEAVQHLWEEQGRPNDLKLVIIGDPLPWDPAYRDRLRLQVQRHNLQHLVWMPGAKPPDELKYWYSAADLLCLVSSREGCPNVVLESLSCGTPVVATAVSGTPDILSQQSVGVLVQQTVEDIYQGIIRALQIPWDHHAITQYARTSYSWEARADMLYDLFQTSCRTRAG